MEQHSLMKKMNSGTLGRKFPIYTIWTLPFLKIFGVGYVQVRILSLITAIASLIIFLRFINNFHNKNKIILYILLLTSPAFIYFSRIGTYESFLIPIHNYNVDCI